MAALRAANEIRVRRARMKRDLRDGTVSAVELAERPPEWLTTMKVTDFLDSLPQMGPTRRRRLMVACRIADTKTLGYITDRQRYVLLVALRLYEASKPSERARGTGGWADAARAALAASEQGLGARAGA